MKSIKELKKEQKKSFFYRETLKEVLELLKSNKTKEELKQKIEG